MSSGLIALLDDVTAIAKVAAASIDDAASQAARAGVKAAGVVVDDAAVTPRYVVGFAAEREIPIVAKIALGSLRNKIVFLLPAALILSVFAPWVITPLLMLGGLFLCFEGAEKAHEAVWPHAHDGHGGHVDAVQDAVALENDKVAGAIRTDFILSAEIMAISLADVSAATQSVWQQALVLAVVALGITVAVYGAVALIVKADDAGVAMARFGNGIVAWFGRMIVKAMPVLLKALGIIGTIAMLWVGGGIVLHGLEAYGLGGPAHVIHDLAHAAGHAMPAGQGVVEWLVGAGLAGVVGLALGAAIIPLVQKGLLPLLARVRGR